MATINTYCTEQDVIDRIRESGAEYLADEDLDGTISQPESDASLGKAIRFASAEIDRALLPYFVVPILQDDAALNRSLQGLAVDIAAERICCRGGGEVSACLMDAAQRARDFLVQVKAGDCRVPELTYGFDSLTDEVDRLGRPRGVTPRIGRAGCVTFRRNSRC